MFIVRRETGSLSLEKFLSGADAVMKAEGKTGLLDIRESVFGPTWS
jgi:hypothetical protein